MFLVCMCMCVKACNGFIYVSGVCVCVCARVCESLQWIDMCFWLCFWLLCVCVCVCVKA